MEMKAILTDSKSITFNPIEGKEYTKHKYTLRRYTDAEYIEDVINEAEEYEMEEKEYKSAYELLVDDKSILKVVHTDFRTVNPSFTNIFPEFSKIVEEIENYGKLEGETHNYPYDGLMEDGKWTVDVVTFDTTEPDVINSERVTVHTIDTSEDELYCNEDIAKYDEENGLFLRYEKVYTKIHSIEFQATYEAVVNNLVEIFIKGKDGHIIKGACAYSYYDDKHLNLLNSVSNLIEESSIDNFEKYFSMIKDVVSNDMNHYITNASNELTKTARHEFHDVVISLGAVNSDSSLEPSKEKLEFNEKLKHGENVYEMRTVANDIRKKLTTRMEQLKRNTDEKLNMNVFVPDDVNKFNEDDLLYRKVINPITNEIMDVVELTYNQLHTIEENQNNRKFHLHICNSVLLSRDGRVFISSTHMTNIFTDIIFSLSKDTILKLVEDLDLTVLAINSYDINTVEHITLDKLDVENIMRQLYLEISPNKIISRKTVKTLLGENYNLSSKEVLDFVNEVKNIISDLKEIVNKAINK